MSAVVYWEWLCWRSNQREASNDAYYDKAFERVLHFVFVKLVKEEIQDMVDIIKVLSKKANYRTKLHLTVHTVLGLLMQQKGMKQEAAN